MFTRAYPGVQIAANHNIYSPQAGIILQSYKNIHFAAAGLPFPEGEVFPGLFGVNKALLFHVFQMCQDL